MIRDLPFVKPMKLTLRPLNKRLRIPLITASAACLMTFAAGGALADPAKAGGGNQPAQTRDSPDSLHTLKPAGAKAAQAAARGSVSPNQTSRSVAAAISAGTFAASVRGDGGGTAGGLEKSLNP